MNYDVLEAHALATGHPPPLGDRIEFGGIAIDKFNIPAGTLLISHCHVYDHPSILASGRVELWTQSGGVVVLEGPCEVLIPAGIKHALQALTDTMWYCLHLKNGGH